MGYSLDFRKRVLAFIEEGGSQAEAGRLFNIDTKTIYNWKNREHLEETPRLVRKRKIDREALRRDVEKYPYDLLKHRAERFGVHINAIWMMLRKLDYRYKKNEKIFRKKL